MYFYVFPLESLQHVMVWRGLATTDRNCISSCPVTMRSVDITTRSALSSLPDRLVSGPASTFSNLPALSQAQLPSLAQFLTPVLPCQPQRSYLAPGVLLLINSLNSIRRLCAAIGSSFLFCDSTIWPRWTQRTLPPLRTGSK